MTSGTPFPRRLTMVDEATLEDHYFLSGADVCYYLGEYTARKPFSYSDTNNLISNFKKKLDVKDSPQWRYKEQAILQVAAAFREAIGERSLRALTFVPIPPSESKDNPMHDDRMTRMLQAIDPRQELDIRELVVQSVSTPKSHESDYRLRSEDLLELYSIDESLIDPSPNCIAIVDDMLTAGSHFKAMQAILRRRFPDAHIIGLFIARRVPEADDPWDPDE